MRVVRRAQTGRRRRRGWTGDRRGNMQVIEVMIVGLLVMAAVVAVSTMNVPVAETEGFKQDNERLTKDSLSALANRPSSDLRFGSTLEEYVMKSVAGDPGPLMDYLNKTLPGGALYNVYLDNHYGPPYPVIKQGEPPREAVAGSIQLVPKLAYTFMIPEFGHYHGDFHMNMYSVPIQNGLLLQDEGEPIELAVTFQDVDDTGKLTGEPIQMKTYSHTALRYNDPAAREWPSVSISQWDETTKERRYVHDASDAQLYEDRISNDPPTPFSGDAYNITVMMRLHETAGVKVPKNTLLTVNIPRGFDFDEKRQSWLPVFDELDNAKYWKDWTFEGSVSEGWKITAKTRDSFKSESIWMNISANFRTITDTAYPHYSPMTFSLGQGVQGLTHILVDTPSTPLAGAFGREAYLSVSKPLISGTEAHWGLAFGNNGDRVSIQKVTLRNPDGDGTLSNVVHSSGWADGHWAPVSGSPGHFMWDPTGDAIVPAGSQMWLSFDVTAGVTGNNNFRNRDYLDVETRFNPDNATGGGGNNLGTWEYEKRSWRMGSEWVYRDAIQPYDGDITSYVPGWPDEEARTYWATGGTYGYQKLLEGNTSYKVLPAAFGSNAFGGYQGAHVASGVDIVDQRGALTRDFALGDKVHIRNDFSALFGKLSELDAAGLAAVSDLTIRTSVYTPEKAWTGTPERVFSDSASIANQYGAVQILLSEDLNGDGVQDAIAIGGAGIAYGLDGRDGAKLWTINTGAEIDSAALVDVDEDGRPELLLGLENARLAAYDTESSVLATRQLWLKDLTPSNPFGLGAYSVTDIITTGSKGSGLPDTVVAVSAATGEARVVGLETSATDATKVAEHDASALTDSDPAYIYDLVRVDWSDTGAPVPHVAFSSAKKTVTMLSLPTLERVWVERLPDAVDGLYAVDLGQDGHQDLVADSRPSNALAVDGDKVYTLTSRSGDFAPKVRSTSSGANAPLDAAISGGGLFVVGDSTSILATSSGSYDPNAQNLNGDYPEGEMANTRGLHVAPNGTVYLAGGSGHVIYNTSPRAVGAGWDWVTAVADPDFSDIYDLHVSPGYPDAGPLYLVNKTGSIRSASDSPPTFTEIAHLVTSTGIPHAGLSGKDLEVIDIQVEEDEDGEAIRFWMTSLDIVTNAARLHSYDIAAGSWTEEGSWTGIAVEIHQGPDGTVWVAGETGGEPTLWERPPSGSWRTHTLWRSESGDTLTSVRVQDDGTAWASSMHGNVWTRTGDTLWTPFYVDGMSNVGPTTLIEDGDGVVWLVGDLYQHVPLGTYGRSAHADVDVPAPPVSTVDVTLIAQEGHLGGTSDATNRKATTQVDWFARGAGDSAWTRLTPMSSTPIQPKVYSMLHQGSVSCDGPCGTIELRAVLNNTWSPGTFPAYTAGGVTPGVRSIEVNVTDGAEWRHTKRLAIDADTLKPSSTAVYSSFHGGAVLPIDRLPWTYFGAEEPTEIDAQERLLGISTSDLLTGDDFPHIAIVEERGGELERWVINGTTGAPEAPSDLTTFGFAGTDKVNAMLITQMVGAGEDDLVMVGKFGGTQGSVRAWKVADGTDVTVLGDGASAPRVMADSGLDSGRSTIIFAGTKGIITSMSGSLSADEIDLRWTSLPASAQGKATFQYEIPTTAMYGTGLVVSELSYDLSHEGATITQTARLVDWFNMRPPDREVPRPPIYTIQIVSWFNEA